MKYCVIGSGPAGKTATEELRRQDSKAEITLITEEFTPFYDRTKLMDVVCGLKKEDEIICPADKFAEENKVKIISGVRVTKVNARKKHIKLTNRSKVEYDKLLIATGTRAKIEHFGSSRDGVYTIKNISDARRLTKILNDLNEISIYGFGNVALSILRALHKGGYKARLILPPQGFLPYQSNDIDEGEILEKIESAGIEVVRDVELVDLVEADARHFYAVTKTGRNFFTEMLFIVLGSKVNAHFLKTTGIEINRGIVVNRNLQTNDKDIYAAGDCAEVLIQGLGSYQVRFGWKSASQHGKIAAYNMTLEDSRKAKTVSMEDSMLFDSKKLLKGWIE